MATLLPLLRHAAGPGPAVADNELLERFAAGHDEAAFAELVRRHGPVVFRVCRRVTGPDAEDAFQAVFLVLATRPDAARAAGSVAGWLVGVAGRVARQMRRAAARRARHEAAAARCDERNDPPDLADQFRALDEEIARLPGRLRDPVVLCLLRGLTQDQAASELGRDARTLRRRLSRAKQVLRARLESRGVVPVVAAGLVSGAGAVASVVPGALEACTVAAVFDFLTGGASCSVPVVVAKGVAMTMLTRKLTHVVAALAAGAIGLGVVLAGDGKPVPAPAEVTRGAPAGPAAPPVLPQEVPPPDHLDWAKNEARRSAIVAAGLPAEGAPPSVLIEGICVKVPSAFCAQCGLDDAPGGTGVWSLTPREARMLTALLRAEPHKDVVSRPQVMVADKQTGCFQVGQDVPAGAVPPPTVGGDAPATKVDLKSVGVTLRVTPRISSDGRSILLRAEAQSTQVSPVELGNGVTSPVFNTQASQATVMIPDTGTIVLRTGTTTTGTVMRLPDGTRKAGKKETIDELWVLTVHLMRPAGKAPAPAPKPAPTPAPTSSLPSPTPAGPPVKP